MMDTNTIQILNLVLTFGIAIVYAYQAKQNKETQKLVLENNKLTLSGKVISQENASAIADVAKQSQDNADAIEHTRVQNVRLASAVEVTKVQNDEIATAVSHVHVCVEARVAEIKDVVEKVPDIVKEVVPNVIKEVIPDVIKDTLK